MLQTLIRKLVEVIVKELCFKIWSQNKLSQLVGIAVNNIPNIKRNISRLG